MAAPAADSPAWALGDHITFTVDPHPVDKLKLVKSLRLTPFVFTGVAHWSLRSGKAGCTLSCRDTLLNGRVGINPTARAVQYTKLVRLPLAGWGSALFTAEWRLGQPLWRPSFRVGLAADDGALLVQPRPGVAAVRLRKPVFLTRRWGVEACCLATAAAGPHLLQLGSGARPSLEGCHLDLKLEEVNVVLRL